ncbi:MAG: hypothetical protein A3I66_22615 [Burkholderiales bacterium RIFCSPLOWO2_02_FULL_57_36]|nr:MAG: hypothetical protein A3I66_22615 [Burkholderiales bacterium RIFCSPLOWO2_02_FULL_57_36]
MSQMNWPAEMETGIAILDELHCDLFESMSEATSATDEHFADCYSTLIRKVKYALIKEEQWMEKIDPVLLKMYREQHARVLCALHNAHRKVLGKDFDLGRKIVKDLLPQWYAIHVSTLDMALAIAIQVNDIQLLDSTSKSSEIYIV